MKTAVVILNWNTEGFLRKFLPGLLRSCAKVPGAETVVADNASTDGSLKAMAEEFPQVRTLRFEKNLGFTGGYNRAFAELSEGPDAPEYFLLINSDIEVPENWLGPLVEWMDSHPECGACAPKLHSWQDRDFFEYAGAAGGFDDLRDAVTDELVVFLGHISTTVSLWLWIHYIAKQESRQGRIAQRLKMTYTTIITY